VYNSSLETLRRYRATRLPAAVYLPCAGFLVTAGLAGGGALSARHLALALVLALLLLLQFRLMDDLADLGEDRRTHPERVLSRAGSLAPFYVLLAGSFAANLLLLALQPASGRHLALFLVLSAAALAWYSVLRRSVRGPVLRYHVLALKYPAFVFLLSGEGSEGFRLLLAMALVYLSFALYEALHDRSHHLRSSAAAAVFVESVGTAAVSLLLAAELLTESSSAALRQGTLGVLSFFALRAAFGRRQLHLDSPQAAYGVFGLGFLLLLHFLFGVRS
jgi:hypothetical protein